MIHSGVCARTAACASSSTRLRCVMVAVQTSHWPRPVLGAVRKNFLDAVGHDENFFQRRAEHVIHQVLFPRRHGDAASAI